LNNKFDRALVVATIAGMIPLWHIYYSNIYMFLLAFLIVSNLKETANAKITIN